MANSLIQRLKTLFSDCQTANANDGTHEISGKIKPLSFYGVAGQPVTAEENAAITGLKEAGVLVGLYHDNDERSLVFLPRTLANGEKNEALTTLMSHAYSWATGPERDSVDATFTGQGAAQKLLAETEGAKTFFVADKAVSVKEPEKARQQTPTPPVLTQ